MIATKIATEKYEPACKGKKICMKQKSHFYF